MTSARLSEIALSAPLRAAAHYAQSFVMIDDLHEAENLSGEMIWSRKLKEIFARSKFRLSLAGRADVLF